MNNAVLLQWKEFNVPVERLKSILKNLLGSNFDGIICEPEQFYVVFIESPSQGEIDQVTEFWDNATEIQFSPSLKEIITVKINEASTFGRALILDFAVENVQMGITQAGKTRDVADYLAKIQRYLESGSLYAALAEANDLITAGVPSELNPYVTDVRLTTYRDRIQAFLTP